MKIDRIEIHRVCNPIKRPYITAFGKQNAFNSIVVALSSSDKTGYGESAMGGGPFFSPYYDATSFLVARDFIAPSLIGRDIGSSGELQDLFAPIRGNAFAKAAFDVAWWDLDAQLRNIPLKKAIGSERDSSSIGYTFGVLSSFDDLLEGIDEVVRKGYPRVKLKFCPGWELDMLSTVRSAFPNLTLHIDCNSAYTLADLPLLKSLDPFNLAMIEQPLMYDDILDHAKLQKQIATPICLDESIVSIQGARQAIEIGACKVINVKYARVGGITNTLSIHELCGKHGIGFWLGGMGESSLGTTVVATLATLPNVTYPSDVSPADKFYRRNLGTPVLTTDRPGTYTIGDTPGLGVTPEPNALKAFTLESCEVTRP